jgi:hypothetical protein
MTEDKKKIDVRENLVCFTYGFGMTQPRWQASGGSRKTSWRWDFSQYNVTEKSLEQL